MTVNGGTPQAVDQVATQGWVREHLKVPGYDYPAGNMLCRYFEACEKYQVVANSYVTSEVNPLRLEALLPDQIIPTVSTCRAAPRADHLLCTLQLLLRVRNQWPLPYYKIVGLDLDQKIDLMFKHLDADGSGGLTTEELMASCEFVDPRVQADEAKQMMDFMDTDHDGNVSREEFGTAMKYMFEGLSAEEIEQSVLEVLSFRHSLEHIDKEAKFRSLFEHLDIDGSGFLDINEIRMVSLRMSSSGDWETARRQMDWLDSDHDGQVTVEEFIEGMNQITERLSVSELVSRVESLMSRKGYLYNFSRAYIGDKGVLPLLEALELDDDFNGLNLSNCGIRNRGCQALAEFVATHPQVTTLHLENNPISTAGAVALLDMLRRSTSVTFMNLKRTHITSPHSWTHPEPGPPRIPDTTEMESLLAANRAAVPPALIDVRALMLEKSEEMKTLFYSLVGEDGRLDQAGLEAGLRSWIELDVFHAMPEQLIKLINPARMYSLSGQSSLSYEEFKTALQRENTVAKVVWVLHNKRQDLKVLFYTLAGKAGKLSMSKMMAGLRDCLKQQDWNISIEEASEVITRDLFSRSDRVALDHTPLSWPEFINPILALDATK